MLATATLLVSGQDTTSKSLQVKDLQKEAAFPGGKDSLNSFLQKHIQYPRRSIMNGEKGRVVIEILVNKQGEITETSVLHTLKLKRGSLPGKIESTNEKIKRPLLEAEALRVVKSFPKFIPAINKSGKAVDIRMQIPITFWVGGL